jgi:hypothetical protein
MVTRGTLLVVLVACGSAVPPPQAANTTTAQARPKKPPPTASEDRKLVILVPEGMSNPSVDAARALNTYLHDEAKRDTMRKVDPATYEVVDMKLVRECQALDVTCLLAIGEELHASELLYGSLHDKGKKLEIELHLFDVDSQVDVKWTGGGADLKTCAKNAYQQLTHPVQ